MNTRYRLLIFDWDGTLMDSEAHIVACVQAVMAELELPALEQRSIANIIGLGMHEALTALFPERASPEFFDRFISRYRAHFFTDQAPQALFLDAEHTLRQLRAQGYLLAVATGKGRHGLDRALAETGLGELFHAHRCADETASKPDPRMVHEILTQLGMTPTDAVMIGDSEYDLQMARNAGIDAIAVSYGVHEPQRLLRYDPIVCLDRISDLPRFLAGKPLPRVS